MTAIRAEIEAYMSFDRFVELNRRLAELRADEGRKLEALRVLKEYYLAAGTEKEIQDVKDAVARIREISRTTRAEIRAILTEIQARMPLPLAHELYGKLENGG